MSFVKKQNGDEGYMNFAINRSNKSEMLLYFWKIIDLPSISPNDLIFRISYELFLLPPEEAVVFIEFCLENKLLIKDENGNLNLSPTLSRNFLDWQKNRKITVSRNLETANRDALLKIDSKTDNGTIFSVLLHQFANKDTVGRTASIAATDFKQIELNKELGLLQSYVKGSEKEPYKIEIDIGKKLIRHNCHDFETRRSKNKKFCKHIVKFIMLLREDEKEFTENFLKNLANDIQDWEFIS
jgi:hypothetical protein